MLDVQVRKIGETYVVTPAGELDLATARGLGDALAGTVESGATRVVLDLRQLTFVDSSGISMIIKLKRFFVAEGVRFGLVKGDDRVQRAFELSRVEPLLPWTAPPTAAG